MYSAPLVAHCRMMQFSADPFVDSLGTSDRPFLLFEAPVCDGKRVNDGINKVIIGLVLKVRDQSSPLPP